MHGHEMRNKLHKGEYVYGSMIVSESPRWPSAVSSVGLDFVFIDAQHDYDSVKKDIEIWTPKLKPGGLLSGHDYQPNFKGVIQAVDEAVGRPIIGENDTWATWI